MEKRGAACNRRGTSMAEQQNGERSLDQLTDQEGLALIALAREIVSLDGRLPDAEREALDNVAAELGPERYDALLEHSNRLTGTDEELEEIVGAVERPAAREAIYGALFDLASTSSIDPAELELLDWLAEVWELEVDDGDGAEDEDAEVKEPDDGDR
jgi:uncharacterized tellurite resistance protein B-like protein